MGVLIPIGTYFSTRSLNEVFSLVLLILLSIPTIISLIKGAPFVPTPFARVQKILKIANAGKGQTVYDLGCGDGRVVYLAANQYGAKAIGFELSPVVYLWALLRKLLWHSKAKIKFANFHHANLSDADIVFCYLLPNTMQALESKFIRELKKSAKVFSYAFEMNHPQLKLIQQLPTEDNFAPLWIYQKQ